MTEYGPDRSPSGIAFSIETAHGERSFRLPAHIEGVEAALQRELKRKRIQRRMACREHAAKVAWRVLKNWVDVQMAIVEAGLVTVDEVMLPYLVLRGDTTMYQVMNEHRLALPGPSK